MKTPNFREHLVVGAQRSVEPPVALRSGRHGLCERVDERHAELPRQRSDVSVPGVDELPAGFRRLAGGEEIADRGTSSPEAILRLVEHGPNAVPPEPIRAREPRQPGPDHHDVGVEGGGAGRAPVPQHRCAERPGAQHGAALQELATIENIVSGGRRRRCRPVLLVEPCEHRAPRTAGSYSGRESRDRRRRGGAPAARSVNREPA